MQLNELLRKKRIEKGLSQTAVSKLLGYSSCQYISNQERNVALPPTKMIKKMGKLYGFEPGELEKIFLKEKIKRLKAQLGIQ